MSMLLSGIVTAMTLFALIPLFSVVGLLLWRGGRKLSIAAFTQFRRRSIRTAVLVTRSWEPW